MGTVWGLYGDCENVGLSHTPRRQRTETLNLGDNPEFASSIQTYVALQARRTIKVSAFGAFGVWLIPSVSVCASVFVPPPPCRSMNTSGHHVVLFVTEASEDGRVPVVVIVVALRQIFCQKTTVSLLPLHASPRWSEEADS